MKETVDLRLGSDWEPVGARGIRGVLHLGGRGTGVVAIVEELRGNIVFGVMTPGANTPLLTIGEERDEDETTVVLNVDRCDTHALIESKTTFRYPALVRLGTADPVLVDVEPVGDTRRMLENLIQACIASS